MTDKEQLYFDAGISFAKKLKICKENKWVRSYEAIENCIEIRINKVKEEPNLIKALKNGLRTEE